MPSAAAGLGFTLMPMLWGSNQISTFQQLVVAGYAEYVLGMNECVLVSYSMVVNSEYFMRF